MLNHFLLTRSNLNRSVFDLSCLCLLPNTCFTFGCPLRASLFDVFLLSTNHRLINLNLPTFAPSCLSGYKYIDKTAVFIPQHMKLVRPWPVTLTGTHTRDSSHSGNICSDWWEKSLFCCLCAASIQNTKNNQLIIITFNWVSVQEPQPQARGQTIWPGSKYNPLSIDNAGISHYCGDLRYTATRSRSYKTHFSVLSPVEQRRSGIFIIQILSIGNPNMLLRPDETRWNSLAFCPESID